MPLLSMALRVGSFRVARDSPGAFTSCALLLAAAGRESSDAARFWKHGAADAGSTDDMVQRGRGTKLGEGGRERRGV
jgi:hypothetical protein